jgi:mannose-6-phosphate isomerase-like protein (cupin superfamily)
MSLEKVNLSEKLNLFSDYFNPRIVAELNGQHVKLVKFQGEFVWHHHDHEDEMFLVIEGNFDMHLRDKTLNINRGEFIVIPKGVEHKPVSKAEVHILLFEPSSTLNTGNAGGNLTRSELEKI